MSKNLPFPLADFYDALVSKNVKEKLEPFIAQFRKKNTYVVYESVNRLIQILNNKSELPIMKFNALMATRYFFDTCEYAAVTFIEIFMLPVIYQIAVEKYLKRSQQGIELYFVDRGAQNTKQIRRLGLNFVELAAQFIFNCAKVKPYRLIENKELKEESNFVRTTKVLNSKGIQQPEKCIYYIPSYPSQTRKKFIKKLKHLTPEPYISFLISEYLEEINLNKKCDMDVKKLLLFGDSFLTSTMVQIIEEELSRMNLNFINKKKYLNLLNDLVRSGEIESIYLVNSTEFIRDIAQQISKVKGNGGPEQGEYIYPKIEASKQYKKQFYLQFLRVIEIWAHCMPATDEGEQSDVLKIYEDMKKKNFVFPKNVILNKIKKEMEENLVMNQQRNQTLMKLIDQDDRTSSRNVGSYVSSKGEFRFHFPEYKEKTSYLELDQLQYKIFETKKKIARLSVSKEELPANIQAIANFVQNWEEDLETLDIEDQDPHELQILVDEGDLCCSQYEKLLPFYELYKKAKLTYDQFCKKIEFLQQQDNESDDDKKSQASQDPKTFTASQQKPSNLSQSVRKHIQEDYVSKYGHEYQRQQKSISVKSKNTKMEEKPISIKNKNLYGEDKFSQRQRGNSIESKESEMVSEVSNKHGFNKQASKKKEPFVQQESGVSRDKKMPNRQSQRQLQKMAIPQPAKDYIMPKTKTQNAYVQNALKKSTIQHFDRENSSKISSSEQDRESYLRSSRHLQQPQPQLQKKIQYRTERERASPINFGSSGSNLHPNNQNHNQAKKPQEFEHQPRQQKKSYINHSVISKSSYHSQPTEPKIGESEFQQGKSLMNDYDHESIPHVTNGGITVKKSSIKRTQNSGLKASSHKRIQESPAKTPQGVAQAVSPFKKKKSSLSKQARIKQSYIKEFEFTKQNKKPQTKKISDQITYEDVFRPKNDLQASRNQSQISSQSESVIQKRVKKNIKHEAMRETARMNINDQFEYDNENSSSVLKRSNGTKFKQNGTKSPANNLLLFDSKHDSPKKLTIDKVHEDYDIKYTDTKIKHLNDKISEFSKNTSKFASGSKLKSGIKIMSKNDYKSFDSLYKNEYNNLYGESGLNTNRRYQEVTSEYNNVASRTKAFGLKNAQLNSLSPQEKSSVIDNHDYSPVSLEEVNEELQKYKNKAKHLPDVSEIHQPENMPMLYSYCSEKSFHSKMTDSHTRKGNSSNYNDFRACFLNMDKEVLPLNLTKSKAVSSSFSLEKAKNFIDIRCSNVRSSSKVNTVVDAISEKNAKNSILLYKLERQKERLVENLQNKIKELEVNGKMMKTKYALKDQSMRENLESRQHSQRQIKLTYADGKSSRQSSKQNLSSYELLKKSKKPQSNSPTNSQHEGLTALTLNKPLINTKAYTQFFEAFSKAGSKKSLYKKKGLLVKNDQIQIGYMITKKDKHCLLSVFVTPYVSAIKNLQVEVECDHNLAVKTKPSRVEMIETKKQEILICSFTVQNVPFKLPVVRLSFDQNRNYQKNSYSLGLPCTILAFSDMTGETIQPEHKEVYRTDIFKLSKKISKPQKLKETLGSFKELKRQHKVTRFEGVIKYQSHVFGVGIALNDHGYSMVEGYGMELQGSNKFLEYVLATVKFMLEEEEVTHV